MTNDEIMAYCKDKRLRIAHVLHLGALAAILINRSDDEAEDLLIDIDAPAGAHVAAALGLKFEGDWEDSGETDAAFLAAAAREAGKLGFVVQAEQPIWDDSTPIGTWGCYANGWFYGETLADAVVAAANGMPALADRRKTTKPAA